MPGKRRPVPAEEVIGLIPDELLDGLADETGVDYSIAKLHGKVIFKLFLYAVLTQRKISLRILEEIFKSEKFKSLFHVEAKRIRHSSLGMRFASINYRYFEKIFDHLLASPKIDSVFFVDRKVAVRKIDSTLVTISAKLLRFGMENCHGGRKGVKYSVELQAGLPVRLMLFTEQEAFSDDIALPELIAQKSSNGNVNIAVFDRGVNGKKTLVRLAKENIFFVSRLTRHTVEVVTDRPLAEAETKTLTILSDQTVRFSKRKTGSRVVMLPQEFRLVSGKNKKTGESIRFLTNVEFLSAAEITELYRSRWEIETFFKFIKQELNFSHFLSRTENGVKAVMYLTMIAAILLTLYKKTNGITSWAAAKIRFMDELEKNLMVAWHREIGKALEPEPPFIFDSS
jgi:hypothetical protein